MHFDWDYTLGLLWDRFLERLLGGGETQHRHLVRGRGRGLRAGAGKAVAQSAAEQGGGLYIWFFRSLPLLVLLVFIYNLPQVFPAAGAVLSDPFYAGLTALVLSETAFIAEIHRGGILACRAASSRPAARSASAMRGSSA